MMIYIRHVEHADEGTTELENELFLSRSRFNKRKHSQVKHKCLILLPLLRSNSIIPMSIWLYKSTKLNIYIEGSAQTAYILVLPSPN